MKTKILSVIGAIAFVVLAASCTTTLPHTATSNAIGSKVGEASVNYLLSIIPIPFVQDAGIKKAASNGGISSISTVDVREFNVIGLWVRRTTVVTGE